MTAPNELPHRLDPQAATCRAVIESPKGRRSKYDYDPGTGLYELSGLLPEGMTFPLDFGFIPSTLGEDGDPIDVLVLADEPGVVGSFLDVRLIGVIEAEQTEKGRTNRNDRLVAVACVSRLHARITSLDDLGEDFMRETTAFWVQYNALKDKTFKVLAVKGPQGAVAAIQAAPPRR